MYENHKAFTLQMGARCDLLIILLLAVGVFPHLLSLFSSFLTFLPSYLHTCIHATIHIPKYTLMHFIASLFIGHSTYTEETSPAFDLLLSRSTHAAAISSPPLSLFLCLIFSTFFFLSLYVRSKRHTYGSLPFKDPMRM